MASGISSPLLGSFNNIVNINRSKSSMNSTKSSFNNFLNFMEIETKRLEAIKLPEDRKIKSLQSLNVASTFGRPGSLLSSLFSGALDVGGFLGEMFTGKGKKPSPKSGKAIPKGKGIKLGGVKALGVVNAVFAGLDFAQGVSEGESVGKAAAGAGGALAGSIVGAALGSVGGPLGAIAGSMAGNFLGGYLADRGYEFATGEGKSVKEKTRERLKAQEKKQREQVATSGTTFAEVLNKFENVVVQFERISRNLATQEVETPYGYDEELDEYESPKLPEGTTEEGADSIKYGSGNAEFGETGNVGNQPGWVHGHFQSDSAAAVTRDTTAVVKALLKQGSPVYLNPGIDLKPNKEYSDAELTQYVEGARRAHTHSGTGKSIDVFVKKGTKVPVPLTEIKPTGPDFGGYGRGGLAGYIQGTRTWIGHLKPGSKSGLSEQKGELKTKGKETGEMDGLKPGMTPEKSQTLQQTTTAKPTQDLSQMSTDQLRGMLDPSKIGVSNHAVFQSASKAREDATMQGLTGDELERQVLIASIQSLQNMSMVTPVVTSMQQYIPQQIQQYPDYNLTQSSVTLMPIMMGSSGGSQQRPMVISSGSGGQQMTISPSPSQGHLLNNVIKTMLLTNLAST